MKIVTGKTGTPHVTSQEFRQFVEGTVGQESYILASGENLEPELSSNNLLKIRSGMMCHHGNISCVELGTYDEVTIQNGNQGMKRIDLVVNRYSKNDETGLEENNWVVIQGTPAAEDPVAPAYTEGNLQEGDLVDDCPVFEAHLDGINVTEIVKLLDVSQNMSTLNADLSDLTNETTTTEYDKTVINFTSAWSTRRCEVYKTGRIVQLSARIYSGTILKDYEYTIANVNTEFRPAHETPIYAVAGDVYMQNLSPCMCLIQPGGKILFKTSGNQKQYVDIAGTYIV